MTRTNGWFWKVRDFSLFACSVSPPPLVVCDLIENHKPERKQLPRSVLNISRIRLLWPVGCQLNLKKFQIALVISLSTVSLKYPLTLGLPGRRR